MEVYERLTTNILSSMTNIINDEQLSQLKFVLDLELSKVSISKKSTELALPINNHALLEEYMANMLISGRCKSSLQRYKYVINKLDEHINKDYTKITTQDIKRFLAIFKVQRHCSNTTVDGMRLCLNAFFGWLETEEYIYRNPVKKISKIKNDTQFEREFYGYEIELLRQNCSSVRDRAIVEFLYSTACRVSEMVKLKITDIDFDRKSALVHGKGNKDRYVYFDDKAFVYIKEYLQIRKVGDCEYLFKSKLKNLPMSVDSVENVLKNIGEKSNVLNVHPHRFRVTRITDLINKGMAIQNVQKLAGHSDIKTTERYYRTNLSDMQYEYFKYCS